MTTFKNNIIDVEPSNNERWISNRLAWFKTIGIAFEQSEIDYTKELNSVDPNYKRIEGNPVSLGIPRVKQFNQELSDGKMFELLVNNKAKSYLKRIKTQFRDLHRLLTFEHRQLRTIQMERLYKTRENELNDSELKGLPLKKDKVSRRPAIPGVNGSIRTARCNIAEAEAIFCCAKSRYLILKTYIKALEIGQPMPNLPTAEVELMNRWRSDFKINNLLKTNLAPNSDLLLKTSYLPTLIQSELDVDLDMAFRLDPFFQDALLELSDWSKLTDEDKRKLMGAFFAMSTMTLSKNVLLMVIELEPNAIDYFHGLLLYNEPKINSVTGGYEEDEDTVSDTSNDSISKMLSPSELGFHPIYADLIKINKSITKHIDQNLQSDSLNSVRALLKGWDELSTHSFKHLIDQLKSSFTIYLETLEELQQEHLKPTGLIDIKIDHIKAWVDSLPLIVAWSKENFKPTAERIILDTLKKKQDNFSDLIDELFEPIVAVSVLNNTLSTLEESQSLKEKIAIAQKAQKHLDEAEAIVLSFNKQSEVLFPLKPLIEQLADLPEIQSHCKSEPSEDIKQNPEQEAGEIEHLYEVALEQVEDMRSEMVGLRRDNLNLRQHNEQLLNGLQIDEVIQPQWQAAKIAFDALVEGGASASEIINVCSKMFPERIFFFSGVVDNLHKIDRLNLPTTTLAQRLFVLATDGVDLMRKNGGQLIALKNVVAPGISCQESEGVRTNEALLSLRRFVRAPGDVCEVLPHFAIGDLFRIYLRFNEGRIEIAYLGKHLSTSNFNTI